MVPCHCTGVKSAVISHRPLTDVELLALDSTPWGAKICVATAIDLGLPVVAPDITDSRSGAIVRIPLSEVGLSAYRRPLAKLRTRTCVLCQSSGSYADHVVAWQAYLKTVLLYVATQYRPPAILQEIQRCQALVLNTYCWLDSSYAGDIYISH